MTLRGATAIRIAAAVALLSPPCAVADQQETPAYVVEGDAVPAAIGGYEGDAESGQAIVLDRSRGNCLICHSFPVENEPFQGEIGPPMAGVARRLSEGQIRLRLIDQSKLNPNTIMPPYYRTEGLVDVAPEHRGRPALTAKEIEDVVAYLTTLDS